nr:hypothetical protein [uncultured Gellertiella sp.]
MAIPVNMIALSGAPLSMTAIDSLGPVHGLSASNIRMLTRYFGLNSVAVNPENHSRMCAQPLATLMDHYPELATLSGLLIHAKTQTHNTFADSSWLKDLATEHGLQDWEILTLSMNHCASALSACHLISDSAQTRPVIILTGEKCFHAATCRQSSAALGELPTAMLLNHDHQFTGRDNWCITASRVAHTPKFHANPERMDPAVKREFEGTFGDWLQSFIAGCNGAFFTPSEGPDLVVPYNLNLPLLQRLSTHFGWGDRLYTGSISSIGHLFCSDVFYNLTQILPRTTANRIFCFAAGMGATFGALVIERRSAEHDSQQVNQGVNP